MNMNGSCWKLCELARDLITLGKKICMHECTVWYDIVEVVESEVIIIITQLFSSRMRKNFFFKKKRVFKNVVVQKFIGMF